MKTLIIALVSLFATVSFAKQYNESGCGLGLQVLGKDGNQVLSATTNGTSYSQTFGISSGTSGCVDDGAVAQQKQVPAFIEVNKMALAIDAARGEGETLAGLAQLMGCNPANFGPAMKANYNKLFIDTNMNPSMIETGVRSMVTSNKAQACGA